MIGAVPETYDTVRFIDVAAQAAALETEVLSALRRVIESGDFVLGDDVRLFEQEFAVYCGTAECVGVDNGFSALELALRAAGVGAGDEVVTQANTFIATVSAIAAVGAKPVLVDCDHEGAFDPERMGAAIVPRTKAVIPVHLFGRLGDVERLGEIADRAGVVTIEDAAQAHGAACDGRRAGSFGLAAGFSFYPGKNLGAYGDAGAITTNSSDLAEKIRAIRHYGQRVKHRHDLTPLNRRLDTMQAAVLRVKLRRLDDWNRRRAALADAYREGLEGLPLDLPRAEKPGRHVYHLFVIGSDQRDALRARLQAEGVESGIHYPTPCHLQPALARLGHRRGDFPNTELLAGRSLSLPMYPELPLHKLERTVQSIRRFLLS